MISDRIFSAVVFDMDGVVIDTRKPIEAFWHTLAGEHNMVITTDIIERQIHGCPARQTVYELFPDMPIEKKQEILKRCEHFETHMDYLTMSGVKEFFHALKKYDIPVALVTSSLPPKVAKVIKQLRLEGVFDTIVTADLVEKGKPDPACYNLAAKRLNKQAQDCIVFEDALSGVKASTDAGMLTIGVGGTYQAPLLKEEGAIEVILNFDNVQVVPVEGGITLQISPAFSLSIKD
jgi:sugar-phosphatase